MREYRRAWLHGRTALAGLGAAISISLVGIAPACSAETAIQRVTFNIPADSLENALLSFADQAHVQVATRARDVKGLKSQAVSGEHSPHEALRLIVGTAPVAIQWTDATTVSIRAATARMQPAAFQPTPEGPVADTPAAPVETADDGQGLNDIVVTAQRREERLKDVPLTVVTLSGQALERAGVSTLRDLQTVVAGFTFAGQAVTTQPAIRGVSSTINAVGSENPNALYVDGVYQGTPGVLSNELPDLERIEVLKGPQGTLFGRNASGGAIQIFTKAPSFDLHANFAVEGSYYPGSGTSHSAPHVNVRGFITGPLVPDLLAASISAGYSWTPGFDTDDASGNRAGVRRTTSLRGKLLLTPSDNLEITAAGYYINNNNQQGQSTTPYRGLTAAAAYPDAIVPTQPWHSAYQGDFPGAFLKQYGFSLRMKLVTDPGTFTALTGYNKTKANNFNATAAAISNACLARFTCIDVNALTSNRELSQEINFASRQFGMLSFVGGLYYYDSKGFANAFIQPTIIPGGLRIQGATTRTKAYAAYGEATVKPAERLSIILGIRQNHEPHKDSSFSPAVVARSATFNSTTPRVSVRYAAAEQLNIYGTFSIGYKGGLTGVSNTGNGFQPVAPEKLYAYEVGAKYATHDVAFNGSFFYYDYKNKQEQSFNGTTVNVANTGPVRIYGFDFDASAKVTRELSARATLSWIPEAKYRDFPNASGSSLVRNANGGFLPGIGTTAIATFDATGLRLARAPKVTASTTLSYERKAPAGNLDASVTLFYSSKVAHDITRTIIQPAYATINAQVGYTFGDSGVRVGAFGRNLTNKAYIVSGLSGPSGFIVGYAPPLEAGLSLGYAF